MKVLAFGASSSRSSINKALASYAAGLIEKAEVDLLDLNDFEMPLFSEDKEKEIGHPKQIQAFLGRIAKCDAIVVSFAEHNGAYPAAYKNIFDWCSRVEPKLFQGKAMLLLATSPGARGAMSSLEFAKGSVPRFGGLVKGSFSLPSFYDNFDLEKHCVSNLELDAKLREVVAALGA